MRHVSPQSLANLRPVSATPERARAFAKVHGIGGPMDKRPRCTGTRKDGQPCGDLAAFGTGRCVRHGARRLAGLPGNQRARAARNAVAVLQATPQPLDLIRSKPWADAQNVPGYAARMARLANLATAWQTGTETGDWGPWRRLTT